MSGITLSVCVLTRYTNIFSLDLEPNSRSEYLRVCMSRMHQEATETTVIRKKDFTECQQENYQGFLQEAVGPSTSNLPSLVTELSENT